MKTKKGIIFLLTAAIFLSTFPLGVSAEEQKTPAIVYNTVLSADGETITTTISQEQPDGTFLQNAVYVYTESSRSYYESYDNCFTVSAAIDDAVKTRYEDRFLLRKKDGNDAQTYFGALDAEDYNAGSFLENRGPNLTYDEAKSLAVELIRSGCVSSLDIQRGYCLLDEQYFPATGTIFVNGNALTVESFDELGNAFTSVQNENGQIKINVEESSVSWSDSFSAMKTILETIPEVQSVYFQPYMFNAIATPVNNYEIVQKITVNAKGDIDSNSSVSMQDAYSALMYSSTIHAGGDPLFTDGSDAYQEASAFAAADVNLDGVVDEMDAYRILLYSSYCHAGAEPTWEDILNS